MYILIIELYKLSGRYIWLLQGTGVLASMDLLGLLEEVAEKLQAMILWYGKDGAYVWYFHAVSETDFRQYEMEV